MNELEFYAIEPQFSYLKIREGAGIGDPICKKCRKEKWPQYIQSSLHWVCKCLKTELMFPRNWL